MTKAAAANAIESSLQNV